MVIYIKWFSVTVCGPTLIIISWITLAAHDQTPNTVGPTPDMIIAGSLEQCVGPL